MNNFVGYLNSLNNASGSNENALAESQIFSEYYNKIVIDRKVSKYIEKLLFQHDNNTAIVLTGNAGDGKTSILIQILNRLGYFDNEFDALHETEKVNEKFLYIKDMSELNENRQESMFLEFLQAPNNNMSSLLISNTGPLINTVKRTLENQYNVQNDTVKSEYIEDFEVNLLSEIDGVESNYIDITIKNDKFKFKVINLAKIDNTYFATEILKKMIQDELWTKCSLCTCKSKCPAYVNYLTIRNNEQRIVQFVERLYFWLSYNEQRMTIRQILSHLSYAITGNLECSEISKKLVEDDDGLFKYHFSNLFFGYVGTSFDKSSVNIRAIRELNKQMFEEKALIEDYELFVKEDYSMFDSQTQSVLENTLRNNYDKLGIKNKQTIYMRRAFRRFYMLLAKNDENQFNSMIGQVFGEVYPTYYQLITEHRNSCMRIRSEVRDIIFNGLFKYLVGVYPIKDELYLTLNKNNMEYQNVQLILGTVKKSEIKLDQEIITGNIEDTKHFNRLVMKFADVNFEISYQTLDYLNSISKGKVYTKLNPSFTFDLTRLKSSLINKYGKRINEDQNMKILVIINNDIKELNIIIYGDKLYEC